ncbi:MAG: biopolymer transporter ExbD [Planctomycetota bacterium]
MKTPARPRDRGVRSAMTPLIDVVFILLIFFLVATHVARAEKRLPVDLPDATTATDDTDPPGRLIVTVDAEGRTFLDEADTTVDAIVGRLESAGDDNARSLLIRADRDTPFGSVRPLLTACLEVGIAEVDIAADRVAGAAR